MDLLNLLANLAYLGIVSGIIRYGCYNSPGSPCTNVTLKCLPNRVVTLENTIQFGSSTDTCTRDDQCLDGSCCTPKNNDVPTLAEFEYHVSVFTGCSNQQSCTITVPYNQSLTYDYISYSYKCLKDENNFDISATFKRVVRKKEFYLYGNGSNNTSSSLTRICKVQAVNHTIDVKARYINLRSESCRKIKISSQNTTLFNCTEEQLVILSEKLNITGNQINITIRDLTLQAGEFIWFEFVTGNTTDISIKCEEPMTIIDQRNGSVTDNSTDEGHGVGAKNLTWIIVGVSAGTGLLILIVVVVIAIHMKKKGKTNKTSKTTNRNDKTSHANAYEDVTSLPMNSKSNTDRQSGKKERTTNGDADKILSESETNKRERGQRYSQVNKKFRLYPEVPEQSPHHDSDNTNRDSIVDPTYNHLGETRKPKNSGSSVYDHI